MTKKNYHVWLASILKKAQGVYNSDMREDIDVGGEVQSLMRYIQELESELAEMKHRIEGLEK